MAQLALDDSLWEDLTQLSPEVQRQLRELVHSLAVSGSSGGPSQGLRFAIDDPRRRPEVAPESTRTQRWSRSALLPVDVEPDAIVAEIRSLLSDGQVLMARRMAIEAARRFPEHPRIQTARRILDSDGKPILRPGNEPSTTEEFEWLRNPPQWARGKWVALLGREAVASASTLVELAQTLESMELPRKPLVHRVD
ncbi:MAG: hypothetical protein GY856_26235 [bacterium]|nr:hypothetical protein [bacterium]